MLFLFFKNIQIMREMYGKTNTSHSYSIIERKTALPQTGNHLTIAQNELYLICGCMSTLNESELVVKSCFLYLVVNTFGINSVHFC